MFLALNNFVLVLDLVVWPDPEVDLRLPRLLLALAAVASLIWGSSGTSRRIDAWSYTISCRRGGPGLFVCSLFFLRFWHRTRDEFFLTFALAFALLGIGQAILAVFGNIPTEERGRSI